jgi:hypothetical protein
MPLGVDLLNAKSAGLAADGLSARSMTPILKSAAIIMTTLRGAGRRRAL